MSQGPISDTLSSNLPAEKRQRAPGRTWAKVLTLIVLSAVLIPVGLRAHDWWTHPSLFGGTYGNRHFVSAAPEDTWWFPLSRPHSGRGDTVTFRGTPEERWKINICGSHLDSETSATSRPVATRHLINLGFTAGRPERYCSRLISVRDNTTFQYPSPNEYLVAVAELVHPGGATLDTITYNYKAGAHLWSQRGLDTQTFHLTFKVNNLVNTSSSAVHVVQVADPSRSPENLAQLDHSVSTSISSFHSAYSPVGTNPSPT